MLGSAYLEESCPGGTCSVAVWRAMVHRALSLAPLTMINFERLKWPLWLSKRQAVAREFRVWVCSCSLAEGPPLTTTTFPHIVPLITLLERDAALLDSPEPWENTDNGVEVVMAHLEAARMVAHHGGLYHTNAEMKLQGKEALSLIGEFQLTLGQGHAGSSSHGPWHSHLLALNSWAASKSNSRLCHTTLDLPPPTASSHPSGAGSTLRRVPRCQNQGHSPGWKEGWNYAVPCPWL